MQKTLHLKNVGASKLRAWKLVEGLSIIFLRLWYVELSSFEFKSSERGWMQIYLHSTTNFQCQKFIVKRKKTYVWHVPKLLNLELGSSKRGWMQKNLCLAFSEFLWIGQGKNALSFQLSMLKVRGRTNFFTLNLLWILPSNLLESSMKGRSNFFLSTSHGTFELRTWGFHKRPNKNNCVLNLQLLMPKVGGQKIKFSSSSCENKSSQA
jgi:hypothetical protein